MSNNKFLANESVSASATKLSAWSNSGTAGEIIPANVPTFPDGTVHAQALTDAQLRATPIATTVSGAATETTLLAIKNDLDLIKAKTDNIDVLLSTRTKAADAQNIRTLTSADQVTIANTSIPVTGPLTDTQLRASAVPVSLSSTSISNFPATQATSNVLETTSTGAITSVTNATSSFSVLATNANRKGFVIHNDSTSNVFIAFAATASVTAFTLRLTSQASYISNSLPIYRGVISGIASAVNGSLRITELT